SRGNGQRDGDMGFDVWSSALKRMGGISARSKARPRTLVILPLLAQNTGPYGGAEALVNASGCVMVFLSPRETQRWIPRARRVGSAGCSAAERSPQQQSDLRQAGSL